MYFWRFFSEEKSFWGNAYHLRKKIRRFSFGKPVREERFPFYPRKCHFGWDQISHGEESHKPGTVSKDAKRVNWCKCIQISNQSVPTVKTGLPFIIWFRLSPRPTSYSSDTFTQQVFKRVRNRFCEVFTGQLYLWNCQCTYWRTRYASPLFSNFECFHFFPSEIYFFFDFSIFQDKHGPIFVQA